MAKYKQYEYLPWWLNNLDHNTLTPAEKEVLGLDYYCKRHGTKLSHNNAAALIHRSKITVRRARRRLEDLGLRTTEPAKGSCRIGHPAEYQNEAEFWAQLRARTMSLTMLKMSTKSLQKKRTLQVLSSSEVKNVAGSKQPAGEVFSQAPRGLTNRCSGGTEAESPEQRKARDKLTWQVTYRDSLSRLLEAGWPKERAERLAKVKATATMAKRKADRKKH
jgi:hypothetical protein